MSLPAPRRGAPCSTRRRAALAGKLRRRPETCEIRTDGLAHRIKAVAGEREIADRDHGADAGKNDAVGTGARGIEPRGFPKRGDDAECAWDIALACSPGPRRTPRVDVRLPTRLRASVRCREAGDRFLGVIMRRLQRQHLLVVSLGSSGIAHCLVHNARLANASLSWAPA